MPSLFDLFRRKAPSVQKEDAQVLSDILKPEIAPKEPLVQEQTPSPVQNEVKQEIPTQEQPQLEGMPMQDEKVENLPDEAQENDVQEEGQEQVEGSEVGGQEGEKPKEGPTVKDDRPPKYGLRKLVRRKVTTKTGKMSTMAKMTNLDTFEGTPPTEDDIRTLYVPVHGGGKYLVVDMYSKKLVEKYNFPGEKIEDEDGNVIEEPTAAPGLPLPSAQAAQPQQTQATPEAPSPKTKVNTMDRLQLALGSGQAAAVEKLAELADFFSQTGNMEGLNNVVSALREIATGKKENTAQDKFMDYVMNQQGEMLKAMLAPKGKEKDTMDEYTKFMGLLTQSKELFGGGEASEVAMAREIGGVVKDSMDKVSDTVIQVTGSGSLKGPPQPPAERFVCSRCGVQVERGWRLCPNCGLIFKPGILPAEKPSTLKQPDAEIFDRPAPPIPDEVRTKLSYLHNLAQFIQKKHDPERKATASFKALSEDYQKGMLFLAQFGYDNLMRLAKPWKNSPEIPDREIVFTLVESTEGAAWIKRFFKAIRDQARQDGVVLTNSESEMYLDQINQYSPTKFHYRGKPTTEAEAENLSQQTLKEDVGMESNVEVPQTTRRAPPQTVAAPPPPAERPLEEMTEDELHKKGLSRCPVCYNEGKLTIVASKALYSHLMTNHPKAKKAQARVSEQPQAEEQMEQPEEPPAPPDDRQSDSQEGLS